MYWYYVQVAINYRHDDRKIEPFILVYVCQKHKQAAAAHSDLLSPLRQKKIWNPCELRIPNVCLKKSISISFGTQRGSTRVFMVNDKAR